MAKVPGYVPQVGGPYLDGFAPALSDTVDLVAPTQAIYAAAAGNVKVTMASGAQLTIPVVAGGILPVVATRIWATGTTVAAANLVCLT
jgi:hypothetical protein